MGMRERIGPEPWASMVNCVWQLLAGVMGCASLGRKKKGGGGHGDSAGGDNLSWRRKQTILLAPCVHIVSSPHLSVTLNAALGSGVTMATEESIIRIPPYHYIHVLDQNSNVSRVEVGPKTYIRQDNERLVSVLGCGRTQG